MTTVPMLVGRFKTFVSHSAISLGHVANHEQLTEFAEYRGLEELSSALLNVNDILSDLRLR